jgi:hypothetical protein
MSNSLTVSRKSGRHSGAGTATINFINSDRGQGTQTRTATLTVNAPVLQVTPTGNIVAAGNQGATRSTVKLPANEPLTDVGVRGPGDPIRVAMSGGYGTHRCRLWSPVCRPVGGIELLHELSFIWNVESGELVTGLLGRGIERLHSAVFSPDGKRL